MLKILLILVYYLKLMPGDAYPVKDEEISDKRGRSLVISYMRNWVQLWTGYPRWPIDRYRPLYPEDVYTHQYVQSCYRNLPIFYQLSTYIPFDRNMRHHSFNNCKFAPWKKYREDNEDKFDAKMMLRIYKIRDKRILKQKKRLIIFLCLLFLYSFSDIFKSLIVHVFFNIYL